MPLRFRRSSQIAPGLRVNLNKKSIGVTVGRRGFHQTINSKGRRTTTIGIPGTGISYQHVSQPAPAPRHTATHRQHALPIAAGTAIALALLMLLLAYVY